MLNIPGYTVSNIVYEDSHLVVAYAFSKKTNRTMLLKVVKESTRTAIENAKIIHEYHFLSDLKMGGLFRPLSYMSSKTMMVLEFEPIQALTLREYHRSRTLSLASILKLLKQTASRLQKLHAQGFVHLNIRPDTVLVQEHTQDIYLTGFGYAVRYDQLGLEDQGSLEGNPIYMAPEQTGRMEHLLDARADIYSLGVTFYELLSNRRPFTASGALQWAHAHLTHKPEPLHELDPRISPWISDLIMNMLAKDPNERYPSMQFIVDKLTQYKLSFKKERGADFDAEMRKDVLSTSHPTDRENTKTKDLTALGAIEEREKISTGSVNFPINGHIVSYPQVLDLAAVIQASQIFMEETESEKVTARLMELLVMNAGAHCVYLLTKESDSWYVEAEAILEDNLIQASCDRKRLSADHQVRERLLYQSMEAQQVIQGQAALLGSPAVSVEHTGGGSVLYLPIIIQGQLAGVLYLENLMTRKKIVNERLHVIRNIASQALFAIKASLQSNQRLHQDSLQGFGQQTDRVYELTRREKEVLQLVSQGLSNKEIAAALTISNETVKTHLKKIFEKLKVDKRVKAASVANTLGLLQHDDASRD
ncbi:protein kinase domain-containing protein [Paenibacillus solani]|uniref:Serine/threonine protein kinase n=1 Tax=Paenibacillus solani TaxID=1705565 RepID=A0A0M1N2H1_9BACL|nr:LuxR C-terminal-related transcriptional regulator [Paenibacillus solani]KOR76347.1 hypothetical protein AM231_27440 [Paenibacillus solani]